MISGSDFLPYPSTEVRFGISKSPVLLADGRGHGSGKRPEGSDRQRFDAHLLLPYVRREAAGAGGACLVRRQAPLSPAAVHHEAPVSASHRSAGGADPEDSARSCRQVERRNSGGCQRFGLLSEDAVGSCQPVSVRVRPGDGGTGKDHATSGRLQRRTPVNSR